MAAVDGQQPFQAGPDFLHRIPERRSCCGRFCEITYTFLSNLCAAIVAIFLRIFGSESPAQLPAEPSAADQAALQQQQARRRAEFEARMRQQRSQGRPAAAAEDSPPPVKGPTIKDHLNNACAILSNPSASLDDLNTADTMLATALQLQQDDDAWDRERALVRKILLGKLYEQVKEDQIPEIDTALISARSAIEPLNLSLTDLSLTSNEHLATVRTMIQPRDVSIATLLAADKILMTAFWVQKHEKTLIVKVQEARGTILYRRYLLDPQGRLPDLDAAIEIFRFVAGPLGELSSNVGLPSRTLAQLLFVRYLHTNQKDDLNESIAIYNDTIPRLPPNMQPQARCELGDAYTLRGQSFYDLERAYEEYLKAFAAKNQELGFYLRAHAKFAILALMKKGVDSASAKNQITKGLLENSKNVLQNGKKTTRVVGVAITTLRIALEFDISEPELRQEIEQTLKGAEELLSSLEQAAADSSEEDAFSLL